jgi:hypothetical protein
MFWFSFETVRTSRNSWQKCEDDLTACERLRRCDDCELTVTADKHDSVTADKHDSVTAGAWNRPRKLKKFLAKCGHDHHRMCSPFRSAVTVNRHLQCETAGSLYVKTKNWIALEFTHIHNNLLLTLRTRRVNGFVLLFVRSNSLKLFVGVFALAVTINQAKDENDAIPDHKRAP